MSRIIVIPELKAKNQVEEGSLRQGGIMSYGTKLRQGGFIGRVVSLSFLSPVYCLRSLLTEENQKPGAQEPLIQRIHVDLQSREQGTYCMWKTSDTQSVHDPSQPAHCPPGPSTSYFTFFLTLSTTTVLSFFFCFLTSLSLPYFYLLEGLCK